MITLRRYLFFFLAVCTALAVGIAVGSGPLQERLQPDKNPESAQAAELRQTVTSLRLEQRFDDAISAATLKQVVRDKLAGRSVALLVLPRVADSTVAGVSDAIAQAGATITVTARLSPDLIDPGKKTYVDSVADSSLAGRDDLSQTAGAQTYERISAVLARAYVGRREEIDFDEEAADIHAELEGARLVSAQQEPVRRAALAVILGPAAATPSKVAAASNVISATLATTVAAGCDAALVAAPPSSSSAGGLLTALAKLEQPADAALSSLNVIASPAGQVAAVYALAATANGQPGEFGAAPSGVRLPPGLAPAED